MQNSLEKSLGNHEERESGMEDSPMITIEYLRARLLAERSVSKAAKERSDELSKRVTELEEQLKIVKLQRKRAEKATLDVVSFLVSHGINDISEVYESESDEDESLCESNMGKNDGTKEEEKFGELKGSEKESLGSDNESTHSSGRSLSWKGRKETTRKFEKKYFESSIRRLTSFAQTSSSPRHRLGKSCRQIKQRDTRSTADQSIHNSSKFDAKDIRTVDSRDHLANCLDTGNEALKRIPDKRAQARECGDSSSIYKHECSGEMERALEHQAQLIVCYEAQEKAQRDWEEKYGENNISTSDSCEPGDHSDVTEERDENKPPVAHSTEFVASQSHDQKAEIETEFQSKQPSTTHLNSFKLSPLANVDRDFRETQVLVSPTPDFAFSTVKTNPNPGHHLASHSFHTSPQNSRLGGVLEALQEAKLLINRQMNSLPETSGRVAKPIETWVSDDGLKIPGLFRVPTDLQTKAPSVPGGVPFSSSPVVRTEPGILSSQPPGVGFHFSTTPSSYSSFPDGFPRMSSDQTSLSQFPGTETWMPPLGKPLFYGHDVRPNMYR